MTEHRYIENARQLDDDLVDELTTHRQERAVVDEEKQATYEASQSGGLDAIIEGTPMDVVQALINKEKHMVDHELKMHVAKKKMASMLGRGTHAVETFLRTKD